MLFLVLIVTVVVVWLFQIHFKQEKKRINLPGPKGWPIIGTLDISPEIHLQGSKLHAKFGKLVYHHLFDNHVVMVGDAKLAREIFSLDQMSGRPYFPIFLLYEGECRGLGNTEGDLWETHRRFTLRQLRDFGFAKTSMESLILDEMQELVETLKKKNGTPVDQIKGLFTLAVVNSLWTLVNGKRYNQDDPSIKAVANSLASVFVETAKSGGIIFFAPWTRHIIPKLSGYTAVRQAYEQLKKFLQEAVNEHKKTFQPESCRDFIDMYLKEMQSATDPSSSFYGADGEKQLLAVISDLFFAGNDTTSTTLSWAILYLAKHQHVQEKLYAEICTVTGDTRGIGLYDRSNTPYLLATIDEVLRIRSILPMGVLHKVTSDVTHNGVKYYKDTMMGMSAYYIHHNPELWNDPEEFQPERFLSADQKTYKKNDNLIAFSVGKRHCLGETLARDSLFLFLGNIVQNFHVICDPNQPDPSLEPAKGFFVNPQEYSVIFNNRS